LHPDHLSSQQTPNGSSKVIRALRKEGIQANVIGKITSQKEGLRRIVKGEIQSVPKFERDEIARYFETLTHQKDS